MFNQFSVEMENVLIDIETENEVSVQSEQDLQNNLILYNDDVNSFDFVIDVLMEVCKHHPIQAEQCTYLVHHKGRCAVKKGSMETLVPLCEELLRRGLSAKIE